MLVQLQKTLFSRELPLADAYAAIEETFFLGYNHHQALVQLKKAQFSKELPLGNTGSYSDIKHSFLVKYSWQLLVQQKYARFCKELLLADVGTVTRRHSSLGHYG